MIRQQVAPGNRPDRIELANLMSGLWAEFVRSGAPGPEWPAYELADRKTMVFDTESRVELDPLGGERALFERLRSVGDAPVGVVH